MAAALVLAPGVRAAAEPARPAALGWVRAPGAESCIGTTALAQAVEARLGREALVSASRAEVSVEGRIAPADGEVGWTALLAVADATGKVLGTRVLSRAGADCRAMDEDLVLTIALLIDPEAALSGAPKVPVAQTTVPVTTAPLAAPPAAGSPRSAGPQPPKGAARASGDRAGPAPPSRPWNTAFLAGPVVSMGSLPTVGIGAQIRALVTPVPFFSVEIGGAVWAPATASLGDTGGRFFLALGALAGCPLSGVVLGFRYAACLGVEAGAVHAGGFGFPLSLERDEPLVNGLLESRVVRRFAGPFAASLGVGLSVPFLRHQFYYVDPSGAEREVFLASPIAGNLDVLVGFDL